MFTLQAPDIEGVIGGQPTCTTVATLPESGRRRWWLDAVEWVVEARSHRVIVLVLGIWLLNGFDLALTVLAHQQGILHEQNPLANRLLQQGTWSILLYKTGLVLLGSYPLLRFRRARVAEMAAIIIWVVYAAVAVHWSTCYELYILSAGEGFTSANIDSAAYVSPY